MKLEKILQEFWGYQSFRDGQRKIIELVVNQRDVLAILPTGAGKSICYQVPALALPGVTLVVSPLVSLMQDQVLQLRLKGVSACALHSGYTKREINNLLDNIISNQYKIVYVSPERLNNEDFIIASESINWNFLAVDEAHCISEWGHDFRPLYRDISKYYKSFSFKNIVALTASATVKVEEDIKNVLELDTPFVLRQSIVRQNLFYEIEKVEHKFSVIAKQLESESGIVYCPTRKSTEEIATYLNNQGVKAVAYHAGLAMSVKDSIQDNWIKSNELTICATNAFGMGIDKPNVRQVLHMQAPKSIEAYYQEAGRAGRDQLHAKGILYYSDVDKVGLERSVDYKFPPMELIWSSYNAIMNELQLSINDGKERLFFIDPIKIAKKNKINILSLLGSIKILEQNNYWVWQQDDSSQHKARFTVLRRDLEDLNTYAPHLYEFGIALLRMYGEILNYYTVINPFEIGKFTGLDFERVILFLNQMDKMNILSYQPALKGSSLYLLEGRISPNEFSINKSKYLQMRLHYKEQINAVLTYINDSVTCRNVLLGNYFGELDLESCGNCDNCKRKNELPAFDLMQSLKDLLEVKKEISVHELFRIFNQYTPAQVLEKLQMLSEEQLVKIIGTNVIFAR